MSNDFHRNLLDDENHAVTVKTFADITARDADTAFQVTANINKVVKVTSPVSYFILASIGPAVWVEVAAADPIDTFLELSDTPGSYSSQAGNITQVNVAETALEFGQKLRTIDSPQFTDLSLIGINLVMADVPVPTNLTADNTGLTIKGTTDKSILWKNSDQGHFEFSDFLEAPQGLVPLVGYGFIAKPGSGMGFTTDLLPLPEVDQVYIAVNGTRRLILDTNGIIANFSGYNKAGGALQIDGFDAIDITGGGAFTGSIKFFEDIANGLNFVALRGAQSVAANITFDLPAAFPATNGEALVSSTAGILSFVPIVTGGDFSGPGSSTDNAIVRFDGTTGKLGQNSLVTISDGGEMIINLTGGGINLLLESVGQETVLEINSDGGFDSSLKFKGSQGRIKYTDTNQMMFFTNTLERVRILADGKFGINTGTPDTRFQVNDTIIDDASRVYDSTVAMIINPTPTSNTALNDPKEVLYLGRQGTTGEALGALGTFKISRHENNSDNSRTRLDLDLTHDQFDDVNIMTWLSSGNVGIGDTDPISARLVINASDRQLMLDGNIVRMTFKETDAAVDEKVWDEFYTGGVHLGRAVNDTDSNANSWLLVTRTGFVIENVVLDAIEIGLGTFAPTSKVSIGGSLDVKRLGSTGSPNSDDEVIIGLTDLAASRTVTILTADIVLGRLFIIKDESGNASVTTSITIDTQGSETIDGASTVVITTGFGVVRLYSDGSNLFSW